MQALNVTNVSAFTRYGVKGSHAEKWLIGHGLKLPKSANSWLLQDNTLVLRLGLTEFLIEDQSGGSTCTKLLSDSKRVAGVYKVPHADSAYILAGSQVVHLLSEVCALDLCQSALPENTLVMTQVAGISATVLRQSVNDEMVYRIWCDGTYGTYLQHILDEMAKEMTKQSTY